MSGISNSSNTQGQGPGQHQQMETAKEGLYQGERAMRAGEQLELGNPRGEQREERLEDLRVGETSEGIDSSNEGKLFRLRSGLSRSRHTHVVLEPLNVDWNARINDARRKNRHENVRKWLSKPDISDNFRQRAASLLEDEAGNLPKCSNGYKPDQRCRCPGYFDFEKEAGPCFLCKSDDLAVIMEREKKRNVEIEELKKIQEQGGKNTSSRSDS